MSAEAISVSSGPVALRIRQAAALLNVSPRTVWRMIADQEMAVFRIRGCTRIPLEEVQKHMRNKDRDTHD